MLCLYSSLLMMVYVLAIRLTCRAATSSSGSSSLAKKFMNGFAQSGLSRMAYTIFMMSLISSRAAGSGASGGLPGGSSLAEVPGCGGAVPGCGEAVHGCGGEVPGCGEAVS